MLLVLLRSYYIGVRCEIFISLITILEYESKEQIFLSFLLTQLIFYFSDDLKKNVVLRSNVSTDLVMKSVVTYKSLWWTYFVDFIQGIYTPGTIRVYLCLWKYVAKFGDNSHLLYTPRKVVSSLFTFVHIFLFVTYWKNFLTTEVSMWLFGIIVNTSVFRLWQQFNS